jgi:hypothetical protein
MPMSVKCQKNEKRMTINVIQHDDKLCYLSNIEYSMDLYIYKRWKICAGDLRIVREQLTATLISMSEW